MKDEVVPTKKQIVIEATGRMANQMMQLMLAIELRNRISPETLILGLDLPEWGLRTPPAAPGGNGRTLTLSGASFNLDRIAHAVRTDLFDTVIIRGWGMRLDYYRSPKDFAGLFRSPEGPCYIADEDEILLHVRAEDVLSGYHSRYFPMPIAYYRRVVDASGLRPVFIGQLQDSRYSDAIRARFPEAKFLPPASAVSDFQSLRNARHLAISVSSFSWLAAWLSQTAVSVHMPLSGIFTPDHSATMLLPVDNPRYRFYNPPFPSRDERKGLDIMAWLTADHEVAEIDRATVAEVCRQALFPPVQPYS